MNVPLFASLWVSGLSLLISFVALLISWLAFRRDRSNLKIRVGYQDRRNMTSCYRVILTNAGRRPVCIEDVNLVLFDRNWSYVEIAEKDTDTKELLPVILTETEPCTLLFPLYTGSFVSKKISDLNTVDIRRIEVNDTTGKVYKYPSNLLDLKSLSTLRKINQLANKDWKPVGNIETGH